MQASIINFGVKQYLQFRYRRIDKIHNEAPSIQLSNYKRLLERLAKTQYGKDHDITTPLPYSAYRQILPIVTYEDLYPYIERSLTGEQNVLYPGQPKYFAKSSGTSNARSKYLPVTEDMINDNFICSSWDAMAMVYEQRSETRIFANKSLLLGGTIERHPDYGDQRVGDVSAIMINEMPAIGRPFYTPDFETAMLDDFGLKLDRMCRITKDEPVAMFGGVPSWLLVLCRKMLELTSREHMGQVWPDARLYMHGGVGFKPYQAQFDELFPEGQLNYMEVYNASEGYIALQDQFDTDDMLLMADNGIFYEFITLSHHEAGAYDQAILLDDVEIDQVYVIVLSTVGGLWRYIPGDTVRFTSVAPYRIQVAGRVSQYINVFGEEVMVSNTDQALAEACALHNCQVADYTVAPIFLQGATRGGHEWLVEWEKAPEDLDAFASLLDDKLRAINSDYDAKRYGDMALGQLKITSLQPGTFRQWLHNKGKSGAQVKVPRLSNDRAMAKELITLLV